MHKKITFPKISDTIQDFDGYITRIHDIAGPVKNVTIEGFMSRIQKYEYDHYLVVLLELKDHSNKITCMFVGNREEIKPILKMMDDHLDFRVNGDVYIVDEKNQEELNHFFPHGDTIQNYITEQKLLCVKAIEGIEKNTIFGVSLVTAYDLPLEKSYYLINDYTDDLKNIALEEIKEIKFSAWKDIIILLKNGILLINGKKKADHVKRLCFVDAMSIFSIDDKNRIVCLTRSDNAIQLLNNHDYQYKKLILTSLGIVAFTYENTVKCFGNFLDIMIDYTRYLEVEDIGYVPNTDDIVVLQNQHVYSLFGSYDYSQQKPEIVWKGEIVTDDHSVWIIDDSSSKV